MSQMFLTTAGDVLKDLFSETNLVDAAIALVGLLFGLLVKKPLEKWWSNRGTLGKTRKDMYSALADIENALAIYSTKVTYVLDKFGSADRQLAVSESATLLDDFHKTIYPAKYAKELKAAQAVRGKMRGEVESFERVMQELAAMSPSQQALAAFNQQFHRELKVGHFDSNMRQSASEERRQLDSERLLREAAEAIDNAKQARDKILKSL
jgi:hypothetical protein